MLADADADIPAMAAMVADAAASAAVAPGTPLHAAIPPLHLAA
jgi:hypothetical protein